MLASFCHTATFIGLERYGSGDVTGKVLSVPFSRLNPSVESTKGSDVQA